MALELTEQQQDDLDRLRRLVGAVDFDDEELYGYLVENDSLNAAAAAVWGRKAADAADLIDVKEGSSSRPLSQLRTSALAMRDHYTTLAAAETASAVARTRVGTIGR